MRPRLTVIAICKNESHNVKNFLGSVGLVADEIVVADTGSMDGTQDEFKKFGFMEKGRSTLKLRHFKWCDNFAAARNFSLAHATGEWILWMDLDDRLSAGAPAFINEFKKHPHNNSAFGFLVASQTEEKGAYVKFIQLRMFPNIRGLAWRKPIHESLHESLELKKIQLQPVQECVIIHTGYMDPILKKNKAIRNASILEKQPDETYEKFYQLGDAYFAMAAFDIGCVNYYKARGLAVTELQKNSATERIILGRRCMDEGDIARREYAMLPVGIPEQLFWEANFAFEDKDYDKAGPIYEKILDIEYKSQSMNSYLDAYKAHALEKLTWMQEQCYAEEAKKEEAVNG